MSQKNMIGDKYRNKYKGAADWIGVVIEKQCVVTTEENKTPRLDLDKLFALAEANYVDVSLHRRTADNKNAPGRLRMTIGNMLRSRAKRRGGLLAIDGSVLRPEGDFEVLEVPTEDIMTGEKIKVEKPSKDEAQTAATDGADDGQGTSGAVAGAEGAETPSDGQDGGASDGAESDETKPKRNRKGK